MLRPQTVGGILSRMLRSRISVVSCSDVGPELLPSTRLGRTSITAIWPSSSHRVASVSSHRFRVFCPTMEVKFFCRLSGLSSNSALPSSQITYLCFELLPDYVVAVDHLVLHGVHLSYEVSSYFAHVRFYFRTYVRLQFF